MPKVDIAAVPARQGSGYPAPYDALYASQTRRQGDGAGRGRPRGVPKE